MDLDEQRGHDTVPPRPPPPAAASTLPPPSSLAVYIKAAEENDGRPLRDDFQQLLNEILGPGGWAADDLPTNHKLVTVVTTAGLSSLLNEEPFASVEQSNAQASMSLHFVKLAIRNCPQVLFYAPPGECSPSEQQLLSVWLLGRLIPLLGHPRARTLADELVELVESIAVITARCAANWQYLEMLYAFLQSCLSCSISALQRPATIQAAAAQTFVLELPGPDFAASQAMASAAASPSLDHKAVGFTLTDPQHISFCALYIFSILHRLSTISDKMLVLRDVAGNAVCALQAVSKLWTALGVWEMVPCFKDMTHNVRSCAMHALDAALESLPGAQGCGVYMTGMCSLAIRTVIEHLRQPLQQVGDNEPTIACIIVEILRLSEQFPRIHDKLQQKSRLLTALGLSEESSWDGRHHDIRIALIRVAFSTSEDPSTIKKATDALQQMTDGAWTARDTRVVAKLQRLKLSRPLLDARDFDSLQGPSTRPHGTQTKEGPPIGLLTDETYLCPKQRKLTSLAGLDETVSIAWGELSEDRRCHAVRQLGLLSCALADNLSISSPHIEGLKKYRCSYCDDDSPFAAESRHWADDQSSELFKAFEVLLKLDTFQQSCRIQTWATASLRRMLNHTRDLTYLDIARTAPGYWCIGALQSSQRTLRIAAGRTLPAFIGFSHDEEVLKRNRLNIFEPLASIVETNEPTVQETCVLAWGQLGRVSTSHELNIILIRLVDYLGHASPLISAVAQHELQTIASAHGVTPRRLMTPFWKNISVNVVNKLVSKPQVVESLAELLVMEVSEFVRVTQKYTLPYLILWRKQDLLERVADHVHGKTVGLVCHDNIVPILTLLLTQDVPNPRRSTMLLLEAASSNFCDCSLDSLVWPACMELACELLKEVEFDDEAQRRRTHEALKIVAECYLKRAEPPRSKYKDNQVAHFFENNVLGICTKFSDILKLKGKASTLEKMRCLVGIGEMARVAGGAVSPGLPQMFTCLQDALEDTELRTTAIFSWSTLVNHLPEEEIESWLPQTFSILIRFWPDFDNKAKDRGQEMVKYLFDNHLHLLKSSAGIIPSLASVPLLCKFNAKLNAWKKTDDMKEMFRLYIRRCNHENSAVVEQALSELIVAVQKNQEFLHMSARSEQPDPIVQDLLRCLLDVTSTFTDPRRRASSRVRQLCAACLGLVGAADPNRIDAPRGEDNVMILEDFMSEDEVVNFISFFLENRLVKAFKSATDTKLQVFLAYAIQEFLKYCNFAPGILLGKWSEAGSRKQKLWEAFPQEVQVTLRPFLLSKYILEVDVPSPQFTYPIFAPDIRARDWLQNFILDLLSRPSGGPNVQTVFSICKRIVKEQDISILTFLLPFVVLHVVISGTDDERENIKNELLAILQQKMDAYDPPGKETIRSCSETVFLVIGHMTKYVRDKRKALRAFRSQQARQQNRQLDADEVDEYSPGVGRVERLLSAIPPDLMGLRALECNSHARALLYWEQYIRQVRTTTEDDRMEAHYKTLQEMYAHIDEPDGLEGISSKLRVLDLDQQILQHRGVGRWEAVQSWCELQLNREPTNVDAQANLIACLRDSAQHVPLLNRIDGIMAQSPESGSKFLRFAVEASWIACNWDALDKYLTMSSDQTESAYEIRLGRALLALRDADESAFLHRIASAREVVLGGMTHMTGTMRQCHDSMVKLHALSELEIIALDKRESQHDNQSLAETLERRLAIMGTYTKDKQYILALRRAAFELSRNKFASNGHLAAMWLSSSRLSRKSGHQSFNAVLHAMKLGTPYATIEHAKLLWMVEERTKAIQNLRAAIDTNMDVNDSTVMTDADMTAVSVASGKIVPQRNMPAKAMLLLARWLDDAGQAHSKELNQKYNEASTLNPRWEQGHYYLGRYYNKLFETEKLLPPSKQSQPFLNGDTSRLVVANYLRALAFGTKYIFQTLPRLLTLWLDLGELVKRLPDSAYGNEEFTRHVHKERIKNLRMINEQVAKYTKRLPAWEFFTAFPQIMSRIGTKNDDVYSHLEVIIVRVASQYPREALWSIVALHKSIDKDRTARGRRIVHELQKGGGSARRLQGYVNSAIKVTTELLRLCNIDLSSKPMTVSLSRDMNFDHNVAPCPLVIPTQSALTATLPSASTAIKDHVAFISNAPTIAGFYDEVDVMQSLQKPRKLKIRGSDGRLYSFLCKPKDDLRKDARLMEFNNMINRFLKKDLSSIRRSLGIRTYHVTPLNEECGLIEWVNNCRTLRDIITKNYKTKNIPINGVQYTLFKNILDQACSDSKKVYLFTDDLLRRTPPVFHEWFVENFSEPAAWFAARLRFARTAAVMSMVGTVLGLGDRHGENILFDETNGEALHVDFNCLFDKGLTFEKPEKVPFRLTHNMVDALGVAGYEGAFRKTCEVSMNLLRSNEETLMTVLETFIHDPAVDMVKKKRSNSKIPDTPQAVLEGIQNKLRGLPDGEAVPLSVEGHVDLLIRHAVDPHSLSAMYIGWCPMF